jgi:hypothetical protein
MRLHANGNLTIGGNLSDDGYKLDVRGNADITGSLGGTSANFTGNVTSQGLLTIGNISSANNSIIAFANTANASPRYFYYKSSNGSFNFTNDSGLDQVTITDDGNVGINTASPSSKLTIVKGSHTSTIGSSSVLQISDTSATGEAVGDRAEINFYTNSDSLPGNLTHATIGIIKTSTVGNETADLYFGTSTVGGSAVERMRITSAGNVNINGTSGARLSVRGSTNDNTSFSFESANSGGSSLFLVRSDGFINSGLNAASPYNNSTTGRSMVIESSGGLGYLVSTRESKSNIQSIQNIDFISQLNPVQFNYRKKDSDTNTFTDEIYENISYGFIADEVEKLNKELVFYNEDGNLAGVEYNSMIAILTKAIQEQQIQIDSLKNQMQ